MNETNCSPGAQCSEKMGRLDDWPESRRNWKIVGIFLTLLLLTIYAFHHFSSPPLNYSPDIPTLICNHNTSITILTASGEPAFRDKKSSKILSCSHATFTSSFSTVTKANHFYFPFAAYTLLSSDIRNALLQPRTEKEVTEYLNRPFILAYAQSNCLKRREQVFWAIRKSFNAIGVYSIGKCLSKVNEDVSLSHFDKSSNQNAFSKFRFAIAMENSISSGYVTEKVVIALAAGCIPVYQGSRQSIRDLGINEKAIIFIDDFATLNDLVHYLTKLETNTTLLRTLYLQPPLLTSRGRIDATCKAPLSISDTTVEPWQLLHINACPKQMLAGYCARFNSLPHIQAQMAPHGGWAEKKRLNVLFAESGFFFTLLWKALVNTCLGKEAHFIHYPSDQLRPDDIDILACSVFDTPEKRQVLEWLFRSPPISFSQFTTSAASSQIQS